MGGVFSGLPVRKRREMKLYYDFVKKMPRALKYYFSAFFFATFAHGAYNVLFRIYMKNLAFDEVVIGTVISVLTIGTALGGLFGAGLTVAFGKRGALLLGQSLTFFSALLMVNFPALPVIVACNLSLGFGFSILNVVNNPIIFQHTTCENRITGFSFGFITNNVAAMAASLASGNISELFSGSMGTTDANRISLSICAAGFAIAIILFAKFFSFKEEAENTKHCDGGVKVFRDSLKNYGQLLHGRTVLYILQTCCIGFGAGMVVPFFPIYIKETLGASDGVVGNIMAVTQVGMVIGGIVVPTLARKLGSVKTVLLCQLVSIPFLISISMPITTWTVVVSLFARSALMNMANPVIGSLAMELVDKELQTFMSSMIHLTSQGMRALGAFIGGIMMREIGYNSPYIITIIAYLTGSLLFYLAFRKKSEDNGGV